MSTIQLETGVGMNIAALLGNKIRHNFKKLFRFILNEEYGGMKGKQLCPETE